MAQTADRLVVIGRGRLIADTAVNELTRSLGEGAVMVRVADPAAFSVRLSAAGATVREGLESALIVTGMSAEDIGKLAAYHGIALGELTPQRVSLEDAFMELTRDSVEFQAVAA
jgi:ABC-2 type transport system ATP-binding protein